MHAIVSEQFVTRASSNAHAELTARVTRIAPTDGISPSAIPCLTVSRANAPSSLMPALYEPSLCIVVQGKKKTVLGGETFEYGALQYLVVSVTLAMKGQVIQASSDQPYLCVRIALNRQLIGELLLEMSPTRAPKGDDNRALFVARTSEGMLDALLRLTRLLDEPEHAPLLAPLALREIHYRALVGEWGHRLRELCAENGYVQRVHGAIQMLLERYAEPLAIEDLAAAAHMSVSSLHHRFKAVTALSPMQFQKQLRLREARRLMLTEGLEAAAAAYRVGYESASQFSREYRRQFGAPPRREIEGVRQTA